jgi:hypothetical protein
MSNDQSTYACTICLENEPKEFLINICKCKNPSHADCIRKVYHTNHYINCTVCLCDFAMQELAERIDKHNEVIRDIYFPKYDIYYSNDHHLSPYKIYKGFDALAMAVKYHQLDRVKELIEIPSNKAMITSYAMNAKKKNNLMTILCMNSKDVHIKVKMWTAHAEIYKMLAEACVSPYVKNAIGLTAMDYSEMYSPYTIVFKTFVARIAVYCNQGQAPGPPIVN